MKLKTITTFLILTLLVQQTGLAEVLLARDTLAPRAAAGRVMGTAAEECLSALELDDLDRLRPIIQSSNELATTDGLSYAVYQIKIPDVVNVYPETGFRKGLSILPQELGGGNIFNLLYREGRLIAVFPEIDAGSAKRIEFLDFSYLYMKFSEEDRGGFSDMIQDFLGQWQEDQDVVSHFKRTGQHDEDRFVPFERDRKRYFFIRINKETAESEVEVFDPQDLLHSEELISRISAFDDRYHSIFSPIYPTVSANLSEWRKECPVLFNSDKFDLQKGHRLLLVGPAAGVEVWAAALKTEETVHIAGINPLEIANTRMLARIAGFKVKSKIANNLISASGEPVFDIKFDRCFWNMPDYTDGPSLYPEGDEDEIISYRAFWDGDYKGHVLRRFAEGLPLLLKAAGRAMIWNISDRRKIVGIVVGSGKLKYLGRQLLSEGTAFYFFQFNRNRGVLRVPLPVGRQGYSSADEPSRGALAPRAAATAVIWKGMPVEDIKTILYPAPGIETEIIYKALENLPFVEAVHLVDTCQQYFMPEIIKAYRDALSKLPGGFEARVEEVSEDHFIIHYNNASRQFSVHIHKQDFRQADVIEELGDGSDLTIVQKPGEAAPGRDGDDQLHRAFYRQVYANTKPGRYMYISAPYPADEEIWQDLEIIDHKLTMSDAESSKFLMSQKPTDPDYVLWGYVVFRKPAFAPAAGRTLNHSPNGSGSGQATGAGSDAAASGAGDVAQKVTPSQLDPHLNADDAFGEFLRSVWYPENSLSDVSLERRAVLAEVAPEIEQVVRKELDDNSIEISLAVVGSVLYGEADRDSDIDLFILITKSESRNLRRVLIDDRSYNKSKKAVAVHRAVEGILQQKMPGVQLETGYVRDGRFIEALDHFYPPESPSSDFGGESFIKNYLYEIIFRHIFYPVIYGNNIEDIRKRVITELAKLPRENIRKIWEKLQRENDSWLMPKIFSLDFATMQEIYTEGEQGQFPGAPAPAPAAGRDIPTEPICSDEAFQRALAPRAARQSKGIGEDEAAGRAINHSPDGLGLGQEMAQAEAKGKIAVNIVCENDPNNQNDFNIKAYIGKEEVGRVICLNYALSLVSIGNINVNEGYRRRGIGQQLMQEVIRQARKRQATQIMLFNSEGKDAFKFYRRMAKRFGLDMQSGKTNTVIIYTLPPVPAMEGLVRLKDRIFAVLKEIDFGERTQPCVIVIDGYQKVGKSFISDTIAASLQSMGCSTVLLRPEIDIRGRLVLSNIPKKEELRGAKVIILDKSGIFSVYKSICQHLGLTGDYIFVRVSADRGTRYENLDAYGQRHGISWFEREILKRYIYPPRGLISPLIARLTLASRYDANVVPDIVIDNSQEHHLSADEIKGIFINSVAAPAAVEAGGVLRVPILLEPNPHAGDGLQGALAPRAAAEREITPEEAAELIRIKLHRFRELLDVNGDLDEAQRILRETLSIYDAHPHIPELIFFTCHIIIACNELTQLYCKAEKPDVVIDILQRSVDLFNKHQVGHKLIQSQAKYILVASSHIISSYCRTGIDTERSDLVVLLDSAIQIFNKFKDRKPSIKEQAGYVIAACTNLINAYCQGNEPEKVIGILNQAIDIFNDHEDEEVVAQAKFIVISGSFLINRCHYKGMHQIDADFMELNKKLIAVSRVYQEKGEDEESMRKCAEHFVAICTKVIEAHITTGDLDELAGLLRYAIDLFNNYQKRSRKMRGGARYIVERGVKIIERYIEREDINTAGKLLDVIERLAEDHPSAVYKADIERLFELRDALDDLKDDRRTSRSRRVSPSTPEPPEEPPEAAASTKEPAETRTAQIIAEMLRKLPGDVAVPKPSSEEPGRKKKRGQKIDLTVINSKANSARSLHGSLRQNPGENLRKAYTLYGEVLLALRAITEKPNKSSRDEMETLEAEAQEAQREIRQKLIDMDPGEFIEEAVEPAVENPGRSALAPRAAAGIDRRRFITSIMVGVFGSLLRNNEPQIIYGYHLSEADFEECRPELEEAFSGKPLFIFEYGGPSTTRLIEKFQKKKYPTVSLETLLTDPKYEVALRSFFKTEAELVRQDFEKFASGQGGKCLDEFPGLMSPFLRALRSFLNQEMVSVVPEDISFELWIHYARAKLEASEALLAFRNGETEEYLAKIERFISRQIENFIVRDRQFKEQLARLEQSNPGCRIISLRGRDHLANPELSGRVNLAEFIGRSPIDEIISCKLQGREILDEELIRLRYAPFFYLLKLRQAESLKSISELKTEVRSAVDCLTRDDIVTFSSWLKENPEKDLRSICEWLLLRIPPPSLLIPHNDDGSRGALAPRAALNHSPDGSGPGPPAGRGGREI